MVRRLIKCFNIACLLLRAAGCSWLQFFFSNFPPLLADRLQKEIRRHDRKEHAIAAIFLVHPYSFKLVHFMSGLRMFIEQ